MSQLDKTILSLENRLKKNIESWEEDCDFKNAEDEEQQDESSSESKDKFISILKDACALVRHAEGENLDLTINRMNSFIVNAVNLCYSVDNGPFDFIPSFAHTEETMVEDKSDAKSINSHHLEALLEILGKCANKKIVIDEIPDPQARDMFSLPSPWRDTPRLHEKSSRLSRFVKELPNSNPFPDKPYYSTVFQARCGITAANICSPIHMSISSSGSCVAIPAAGGWKNRDPMLFYILPSSIKKSDHAIAQFKCGNIDIGLERVAWQCCTYEERKLIFVADDYRIKSYNWETELPTHTLSSKHQGPIAVLSDRMLRCGRGTIEVWNMEGLATHGETGQKRVGKKMKEDSLDSMRDEPENIELSRGVEATTNIKLEDPTLKIKDWIEHPSSPNAVISGFSVEDKGGNYSCFAIDLETGKVMSKYLGHGASISGFSTSPSFEPNIFATSGCDGYARLYDVRVPLPVLTFESGHRYEDFCTRVAYAHPDGLPVLFTGSSKCEAIKVCDVRSQKMIYELGTGNNMVNGLGWNAANNTLYAATECFWIDRMGNNINYRKRKKSKESRALSGRLTADENDEDEDDWGDDPQPCWPEKAHHEEDYFGEAFDASNHKIYSYAFSENPDLEIPESGDVYLRDEYGGYSW